MPGHVVLRPVFLLYLLIIDRKLSSKVREILVFLRYYPLYTGVFIALVPICILIFKWRRLDTPSRLLFFWLVCQFVADIAMIYYAATGQNNIWIHNLMIPLRYVLLSGMLLGFLESAHSKYWIRVSMPLFLLFAFVDIYYSDNESSSLDGYFYVRYSAIVECFLMLLWILLYFYELFRSLKIKNLLKSPGFLTAVAWLCFYASMVFFAPVFYYISRSRRVIQLGVLEIVPDCMEILTVLILAVAVSFISTGYD